MATTAARTVASSARFERVVLGEAIGQGAHSAVYRGVVDGTTVAVKLGLDSRRAVDDKLVVRFRREAAALGKLAGRGVPRAYETGISPDGRPYLLLEHVEGVTLRARMAKPLSEAEVLDIAEQLAGTLGRVHALGLVHRDVKPDNVILRRHREPVLLDFGLVSERGTHRGTLEMPGQVAGTFVYSAPEQAGMLARAVDGRADLYALGVVMFECLTGHPPFASDDPGELLHLHAAKLPPRLDELGFSQGIAALVAKLLAKDPDDRYADAAHAREAIRVLRGPLVGSEPHSIAPVGPAPTARPRELGQLYALLEQARAGRARAALISGASGMGKSWLVERAVERAAAQGFEVLRVSCDAQGAPPFGAIRKLLDGFVGQRLAGSSSEAFRERVRTAAGNYAPYLAQLAPCLRPCFALSPAELGLAGNRELLREALVELVMGLGPTPWLIAVDDIHFMDAESLDVLERLAERSSRGLCIVCSVGAEHRELAARLRSRAALTYLELDPLSEQDVNALLRDLLGPDPFDASLAAQLRSSSAGNPLAVLSYLHAMIDAGVVGPRWGRWELDAERLSSLALPGDAASLALARLDGLSASARDLLCRASVLNEPFDVAALTRVADRDMPSSLEDALSEAIEQHVIWADGDLAFRFAHPVLRERLGAELDPQVRSRLHQQLALWLAEHVSAKDGGDAALYALAYHHYHGVSSETARAAYDANLRAAQRALAVFAFSQAAALFEQAKSIAEAHGFSPCWRLLRGLAETYVESGDVPRGLALLEAAAERCDDPLERAEIHVYAGKSSFFFEVSPPKLGQLLQRAYAALGEELPRESFWLAVRMVLWFFVFVFHEITGLRRGIDQGSREVAVRTMMWECTGLYSMFSDTPLLLLYTMVRGNVCSWTLGNAPPLAAGSAAFATALCALPFARRFSPRFFARAHGVADALHDRALHAVVQHYEAISHVFAERPAEGERAIAECLRAHASWLDAQSLVTSAMVLGHVRLARGYVDEALDAVLRHVIGAERRTNESAALVAVQVVLQAEAIKGVFERTPKLSPLLLLGLDDPKADPLRWLQRHGTQVLTLLERGESAACLRQALDEAERTPLRPQYASWQLALDFVHVASARYHVLVEELTEHGASELAQRDRAAFDASFAKAVLAARTNPLITGFCEVLRAGAQRLDGQHEEALLGLSRAEHTAHLVDSPNILYCARIERARVLDALGQAQGAMHELESARLLAERLGWAGRAERAEALLEQLRAKRHDSNARRTKIKGDHTSTAAETSHLARDRAALLEVSLALASELHPTSQAVAALDILLRVLGGERAFIFEQSEADGLRVIAARDADGADLDPDTRIARSLLERACARRRPFVMSATEEGAALGSESVIAENLRSIICAPLVLRDQLVGAVYVDSRLAKGVFTARHLDILVAIANHIAIAQHIARLARHEVERRDLAKDMQLAAAVQALILPAAEELDTELYGVASHYAPAAHVGGDFFHLERLPDGGVRALIGDVTGHGAGSAMVTACVAGLHRAYLESGRRGARELLEALHRDLAAICHGHYSMTLSLVELDRSGRVTWVNAGGPPLVVTRRGAACDVRTISGTPLGGDSLALGVDQFELAPGESLLLFSDGLYEMQMQDGRELGISRLRRMLARAGSTEDAPALRDYVRTEVERARGDVALGDDVTLIVCSRRSIGRAEGH